jgi:hypothetical protein
MKVYYTLRAGCHVCQRLKAALTSRLGIWDESCRQQMFCRASAKSPLFGLTGVWILAET